METQDLTIGDLRLRVLTANVNDAGWYQQRKVFEERQSPLYPLIRAHGFQNFIDVGANYGFISLLIRRAAPATRVLAIEPDQRLAALIEENFLLNGLAPPDVVNVIVGAESRDEASFAINPRSSLDNRVTMPAWEQHSLPMRTMESILSKYDITGSCFFKIDTQGFERHVLAGMQRRLEERADWFVKMEFAPDWLRSQGTDPLELLHYLADRFDLAEFPPRLPYNTRSLASLFDEPLDARELEPFLSYVISLDREGLGWVDLIVRPRAALTIRG